MVNHSVNIHHNEPLLPLGLKPYHYTLTHTYTHIETSNWYLMPFSFDLKFLCSLLNFSFSFFSCFLLASPLPFPLLHPSFHLCFLSLQFLWEHDSHHFCRLRANRDGRSASATEDDGRDRDPVQSQPPHFQVDTFHLAFYEDVILHNKDTSSAESLWVATIRWTLLYKERLS